MKKQTWSAAYPVVTLGAKYLVIGHLLRRNILASKAPGRKVAYDLVCSHPVLRKKGRLVHVQVKCRLASDCDRGFPIEINTLESFDYLVLVFLNVGAFYRRAPGSAARGGARDAEFHTFPASFIRKNLKIQGAIARVETHDLDIERFRNEAGFEQIAEDLEIPYPE